MRGFLRSAIIGLLIFAAVLAIWKVFGGDVGGFFAAIWNAIYIITDGISNVFIQIWEVFFGPA